MKTSILSTVDERILQYKSEHRDELPLYILVSPFEFDSLVEEIRLKRGYGPDVIVTSYNGSKVLKHDVLSRGELLLTDELPEMSS